MHKDTYLSYLKDILDEFDISEEKKAEVLSDYDTQIEAAIENPHDAKKLETLFKDEASLRKELEKKYPKKQAERRDHAIKALTPLFSLVLFLIMGMLFDAWHPGWMVFLLVPFTAITLDVSHAIHRGKRMLFIFALTLLAYLFLGLFYDLWHPGWLILTPAVMVGIVLLPELNPIQKLTALSPFISLNAFILIGYFTGVYSPTWTVFILMVAVGLLNEKRHAHRWILESLLLVSIGSYFLIGLWLHNWALALFAFLIFIIPAIFTGHIHVKIQGFTTRMERLAVLMSIIVFFLWGYFFEAWAVSWVVFLAVPLFAVILHAKGRDTLVPITVLLSILIFYLTGYYSGQWNLAWLVFLAIPLVAIIQKA